MVKKRAGLLFVVLLCLTAVILTSCSAGNTEPREEETASTPAVNCSLPQENRRGYSAGYSFCPSSTSDGVYSVNTVSKSLWYYDAQAGKGTFLCAQSGCTHNDETCQAWIGGASSFTEYHGNILATRQDEDGNVDFIRKNLPSGDIEVLNTWESSENIYYELSISTVAYNKVALLLCRYTVTEDEGQLDTESYYMHLLYNLETGECKKIFSDDENQEALTCMAMYKDYAAFLYITPRDEMLTEEEFHKQYGEDENYSHYVSSGEHMEIRLYNLNTGEYTALVEKGQDFVRYNEPNYNYGDQIVYVCKDTIYLFDLSTLEERELLKQEDIANYWLMDNKVFYVFGEVDDYRVFYADIDNPVPVELLNEGDRTCMKFSMYYEGESFFISNGSTPKIISKEDFYAERYENAHAL